MANNRCFLEIGNSRAKFSFKGPDSQWQGFAVGLAPQNIQNIEQAIREHEGFCEYVLARANSTAYFKAVDALILIGKDIFEIDKQDVGIETEYDISMLGLDRLLGALGAVLNGKSNAVVIDAGTMLTIDVVKKGVHKGGCILCGIGSLEKAYRDILPAYSRGEWSMDIPLTTQDACAAGLYAQTIYSTAVALKGYYKTFFTELGQRVPLFITGGDAGYLFNGLSRLEEILMLFEPVIDPFLLPKAMEAVRLKHNRNA